jgi:DGQHR domain-containing protein
MIGRCGHRKVFMGFASAGLLSRASYADVLDESTGRGYQRRMSREHSLEFKRYIQLPDATSIPLTFNLRESNSARWGLSGECPALLQLDLSQGPVFTQVDGQHRLGFLQGSPIQFAFMTYLGLSDLEEMDVFRTINGKAKGLSSSLLDFTEAKSLGDDLGAVDPALFIALRLNTEPGSPWQGKLDLGGDRTVGTKRIASLRTMHHAADRFLKEASYDPAVGAKEICEHVIAFWRAVAITLPKEWADPRRHVLSKGIGVYALMSLAGYLIREAEHKNISLDFFVSKLSDFVDRIDWSNHGRLEGFGGAKGADMAYKLMLDTRKSTLQQVSEYA